MATFYIWAKKKCLDQEKSIHLGQKYINVCKIFLCTDTDQIFEQDINLYSC